MKEKGRADGYESLTRDELMGLLRERDRTVAKQRERIRRLEAKLARAIAEGAAKQEQLMLRNYNDFVTKRDSVGAAKNASGAKPGAGRRRGRPSGPLPSREALEALWASGGKRTRYIDPPGVPEGAVAFAEDSTYKVEREPGRYVVVKVVRRKYRAPGGVMQAPADPADPFPHSPASPSVLSSAAVLKLLLGVPVDRQCKRMPPVPGLSSPQALGRALARAADALLPVKRAVDAAMAGSPAYANVDETPVRVLEKYRSGGKNGYIFVCVRDVGGYPVASYLYSPTRAPDSAVEAFGLEGAVLVVDGFSGYCRIRSESCGAITLQRCLAHLRRKVLDCLKGTPAAKRAGHPAWGIAGEISAIYAAEGSMEGAPEERLLLRRGEEYMGHVRALRSLFASLDPDEGTALFRAKEYFDNGGEDFFAFLSDGSLPLDNNRAERAVKLFVLSRRNFLFVENDLGGERAATLMTLLENATLRGLDAEGYLTWALSNVLRMPPEELLPWSPKVPESIKLKHVIKNL